MTVLLGGMEISAASLAAIVRNADTTTVDHVRLANQLRASASCSEFGNGMVDVVLYTDEQPEKQPAARFCSKRRISTGGCGENPAKIVRHLRDQLECTNVFRKIQILEGLFSVYLGLTTTIRRQSLVHPNGRVIEWSGGAGRANLITGLLIPLTLYFGRYECDDVFGSQGNP
ncbi:unnamed protein product [Haemonchus placei]|uniref:FGGY_N domain-containing protein n=1 Tax=Haemonchus placei TaxID=6290 RepID=A0A0N4W266_HAEPC|nr:unnamed protein product [Haemonchus placei]